MNSTPTSSTRALSVAAFAGMFVFGLAVALLGAILPVISGQIHFDLARAGTLFLAMNCGMLVTQLAAGPLMDRFGHKPPLVAGPVLVAGGLVLISAAGEYGALAAGVVLLGVGGGMLNGATNTLVADLHEDPARKSAALNVLGVFFGVGAIVMPFSIGALLSWQGLGPLLRVAALITALPALLSAQLTFPPAKHPQPVPFAQVAGFARNGLVMMFAILLFFESGNEFIIGGFTSTYLVREVHMGVGAASYLLALYWAAVIVSRIVLGRLLLNIRAGAAVRASAVAAAAALAILMAADSPVAAAGALLLLGSGLSAIYPTVLGQAGAAFSAYSGTVFGILFAVALSGGMLMPWLLGQIATAHNLRIALLLPIGGFLAIFGLQTVISRRA